MDKNDMIFGDEIAEILGMEKNSIQRKCWRKKTGCPIRKVGKKIFSFRDEFEAWLRGENHV